ncbi:serine hydrolase domain-containing protein [Maricaulis sp. CAU 1757]
MKACSLLLRLGRAGAAFAATLAVTAPGLAQETDPARQDRLATMSDRLESAGFTGHVAIRHGGEIAYHRGAGFADPDSERAYGMDTQVDIGSITKTFTGMAAAALITQGALSPDNRLDDFFEDVPADKAGITVHQMLTHSAGFPGAVGDDVADEDFETFLANAFAAELSFEPGSAYAYSNVGFSLVAAIIERVTGMPFERYLRQTYLLPHGLDATGYGAALDPAHAVHVADRGRVDEVSWGGHPPNWNLIGNGGLLSTPRDMLAWGEAYRRGEMVSPQARDLALTPHQSEGGGSDYGYGIVVEATELGPLYWHNGGNPFFNAHWRILPEHDFILFANADQRAVNADVVAEAMTAAWFGEPYDIPVRDSATAQTVALPDTPGGEMAGRFLDLLARGDRSAMEIYVTSDMTTDMQAFAPMEQHLAMLSMLQADLRGARIVGVTDRGSRIVVALEAPELGERVRLALDYTGERPARLAGLNVDMD